MCLFEEQPYENTMRVEFKALPHRPPRKLVTWIAKARDMNGTLFVAFLAYNITWPEIMSVFGGASDEETAKILREQHGMLDADIDVLRCIQ